ncbi:preprotein translocase subunit SecG [Xylanimonas oleitrophica]|uniref:Protein-export membrane protein SecG n=1 Tax=Xylanimonas oleitrophica TaxID=2607479 RepID=A0A2W5WL71_9MICO|nr:preprotein translocase subunit SecG [Xylanimonas oleitrophica]PZR51930.1 preprotein translocase subunit SecG [Xylanimonas oleitrophica]
MDALRIILQVLLVLTSGFLTLLILLHKGKGGGLSDMFGGGISAGAGSSGVAERNLNRITISFAVVWTVVIVLLGLIQKVA